MIIGATTLGRLPIVLTLLAVALGGRGIGDEPTVRFNRDIRPILTDKCFACHGPDAETVEGGLRLDLQEEAIERSGAIVPGDSEASELVRRIDADDRDQVMPPPHAHKPLTDGERERLRLWIDQGAAYEPHWAYTPMRWPDRVGIAPLTGLSRVIDFLIDERLSETDLVPSPPADRVTLIRRLSFDLNGMPPTVEEVERFLADRSPKAYAKLVDRLLFSPRYGERMAVYWLDLVRYADTVGYHGDQNVSQSPYRDYVIRAFNENLPYDQFVREQLAGDLIPGSSLRQRVASGYNRLNQTTEEGGSQAKEYLAIYFADRVRNVSQVFMGATMGCAQCHDHKYDPYTAEDFYSFGAFFADLQEQGVYGARSRPPMIHVPDERLQAEIDRLDRAIAATESKGDVPAEQIEEKRTRRKELYESAPQTVVSRSVDPRPIRILPRGNWMDDSGELVQPAIPEFLGTLDTGDRPATRLDLAEWLCQPDHPLTARTMANRLWMLLFGRGVCTSVDDLGGQGTYPSHPDLLDALAIEFVESGWDVRHLIRQIVMSQAYRRSSRAGQNLRERDPYNELFARQGRFRLEAEMIRDMALSASGLLVEQVGGPSVRPYQPAGYYAQLNFPKRTYQADTGQDQFRRGVYTHWQRTFLHPMLKAFDAPSREECTAQRAKSNTPLQSLVLLNDPTFVEAARALAERIIREGGEGPEARLDWAYRHVLSREPAESVRGELLTLYDRHRRQYEERPSEAEALVSVGQTPVPQDRSPSELAAWTSVARVLLNLQESVTRY